MSDHAPHGEEPKAGPNAGARPDSSDNTGLKWLAGAAAAVVLLGGGYYALQNRTQSQTDVEVAGADPALDQAYAPLTPAPVESAAGVTDTASVESSEPPPAAPTRRRAPVRDAAVVPEQTIGVTPASVTTENSDEIVVTPGRRPVWTKTPSARRLSDLYPARALERGREGEASVHCTVLGDGALDCVRASETPVNSGFGNAALRVASRFRHAQTRADGSSAVGTPVNLRVIFRIDDNDRHRT
jgi:protein TonB